MTRFCSRFLRRGNIAARLKGLQRLAIEFYSAPSALWFYIRPSAAAAGRQPVRLAALVPILAGCLAVVAGNCITLNDGLGQPPGRSEEALFDDMLKQVERRQRSWYLDKVALEALKDDSMRSICAVRPEVLQATLDWVKQAGGVLSAKHLAERYGLEDKRTVRRLMYERVLLLLEQGQRLRAEGQCPGWQKVEPVFYGLDSTYQSLYPAFETGGKLYARLKSEHVNFLLGGSGRLLLGYGLHPQWDILAGAEFSAATSVEDLLDGQALITLMAWAPLIVRQKISRLVFDYEGGLLVFYDAGEKKVRQGVRAGLGIGGPTLHLAGVSSQLALRLQYDFVPANGSLPAVHQVSAGVTTAFTLQSLGWR